MISHKHQTIFVHIPKAAGQSVEQVYLEECGLDWEGRAPLVLRYNPDPAQGPEKLAHLYADEYVGCGHIGQADFDRYFKFAIVRNPYDRLMSEYRYRGQRRMPFWLFLLQPLRDDRDDRVRHRIPQVRYLYSDDGRLLVDEIVRFEDMAAEMPAIFARTLGEARELPHRNRSEHRRDLENRRISWLSRRIIRHLYAEDFRRFGYDPDA